MSHELLLCGRRTVFTWWWNVTVNTFTVLKCIQCIQDFTYKRDDELIKYDACYK